VTVIPWLTQPNPLVAQNTLRVDLIGRDFCCLVTDTEFRSCTAAHIIPFSRPDVSLFAFQGLKKKKNPPEGIEI
jgi:hypothetical protein